MSKKRAVEQMNVASLVFTVLGVILRGAALIVVIYLVCHWAAACYDYGYRIFTEPPVSVGEGRNITVSVTEDMSPLDVGALLEEKGLVRDDRLFALQYIFSEYYKDVKPGVFELNTAMTAEEMMAAMAAKDEEGTETPDAGKSDGGEPDAEQSGAEEPKE